MKILVKVSNWVGDVVMNLPALDALRARYPDAEIVALARPWVKHLFHFRQDLVNRTLIFEDSLMKQPVALKRFIQMLRAERFDFGVALTRHFKGAFLLCAAGVPTRIGFSTLASRPFLNRPLSRDKMPRDRHQSINYVELLSRAGKIECEHIPPRLHTDEELNQQLRQKFLQRAAGPLLVVHPGAAYGPAKAWLPERFGEVCQWFLRAYGGQAVVLGMPVEQDVSRINAQVSAQGYLDLVGKCNLRESIALTSLADMVLSNDSGMMHVAGAFERPQVAVFGPTDVKSTFPLNPQAKTLQHAVPCSPCKHRICPIGHDCMVGIQVAEVTTAVEGLMAKNGWSLRSVHAV